MCRRLSDYDPTLRDTIVRIRIVVPDRYNLFAVNGNEITVNESGGRSRVFTVDGDEITVAADATSNDVFLVTGDEIRLRPE